jgi:hypothetical protein
MGNSHEEEKKLMNITYQVYNRMSVEKEKIEKNFLNEEISKRGNDMNDRKKEKFILNIYLYSNDNIKDNVLKSFENYNRDIFDWKIKDKYIGFSEDNNKKLIQKCEEDFMGKKFEIVVVIPIKSISNFKTQIEQNDILASFNDLNEEQ